MRIHRVWALALVMSLAGCGGGGSGASTLAATGSVAGATPPAVISVASTAQPWHIGLWSPASLSVRVAQGQSIIVLVAQYNASSSYTASASPTMSPGQLTPVVDPAPSVVGLLAPPVYGQLYAAFSPAPGAYSITPPMEGGTSGDGTMYVMVVSGIAAVRAASSAQQRLGGSALVGISLQSGAGAQPGDLLVAMAVFDDTVIMSSGAGMTDPPAGWQSIGANQDAANFPPVEACWKLASGGAESVSWTWSDPTANVAHALVAGFTPAP